MGIGDWISSGISAAVSFGRAVCNTVVSIGRAAVNFAGEYVPKIITSVINAGSVIGGIASVVCQALGIFREREETEEMGDRFKQGAEAGITLDKFEDFDEYMEAIRNFKLDPEKSKNTSSTEKIMAGLAVTAVGMEHKLGLPNGLGGAVWLLAAANPEYFNADRLNALLAASNPARVLQFFEGKLGPAADLQARDAIVEVERARQPAATVQDIYKELVAARQAVADMRPIDLNAVPPANASTGSPER